MIQELGIPEYHIQSIDIDVEPTIGDTVVGLVFSTIEVTNPEIREEPSGLVCEASIELELHPQREVENDNLESLYGTIEADLMIFIPGDIDTLGPYASQWEKESYEELDNDFIRHVESGILEDVLNPIGDLLSASFRGIVPWMQLTPREPIEPEAE